MLRGAPDSSGASLDAARSLAQGALGSDVTGDRHEFISLLAKARALAPTTRAVASVASSAQVNLAQSELGFEEQAPIVRKLGDRVLDVDQRVVLALRGLGKYASVAVPELGQDLDRGDVHRAIAQIAAQARATSGRRSACLGRCYCRTERRRNRTNRSRAPSACAPRRPSRAWRRERAGEPRGFVHVAHERRHARERLFRLPDVTHELFERRRDPHW